jgi:PTS system sucrose-specific IIC component
MAYPAALSSMLGITEPAIFGVNLRYIRPFICASIGGAVGGMLASLFNLGATATGVTGLFGILLHLHAPVKYIIVMAAAAATAFILTWFFGFSEPETDRKNNKGDIK